MMERNRAIFEDGSPSVHKVDFLSISVMGDYKPSLRTKKMRRIPKRHVVRGMTGWFDGAALASGCNNGVGGVIWINEHIIFKWYINCGTGKNTRAELLGAWALLTLAIQLDISELFFRETQRLSSTSCEARVVFR
jgi:hypothetical protein